LAAEDNKPVHLPEKADGQTLEELGLDSTAHVAVEGAGSGDIPRAERLYRRKQNFVKLTLECKLPREENSAAVSFVTEEVDRTLKLSSLKQKMREVFRIDVAPGELRLR